MNGRPPSHKLQLDNVVIEYTVQRERRRNKTVHISVFNDNIVIYAPVGTSDYEIQAIVWRRSGWILDKLAKLSPGSKELPLPDLATGDALHHSGRKLPLAIGETELVPEKANQVTSDLEAERQRAEAEVPVQTGRLRTAAEIAVEKAEMVARQRLNAGEPMQAGRLPTAAELSEQIERQRREAEAKRAWEEYEVEKAKQAAAQRETQLRQQGIKRAKQAALMANLLKSPVTMAAVVANPMCRFYQASNLSNWSGGFPCS